MKNTKIQIFTFILSLLTFCILCFFTYKLITLENEIKTFEKNIITEKNNLKENLKPSNILEKIFK